MPEETYDVQGAQDEGHGLDDVLGHLAVTRGYDVKKAMDDGFSKEDIVKFLATQPLAKKPAVKQSTAEKAWNWINTGLLDTTAEKIGLGTQFTQRALTGKTREQMDEELQSYEGEEPEHARAREFTRGALEDTATTANALTSPATIGTAAAGAIAKVPAAAGRLMTAGRIGVKAAGRLRAAGQVARGVSLASGGAFAAKGAEDVADAGLENTPEAWQKRLQGGAMVAGGAASVAENLTPEAGPPPASFGTKAVQAVKDVGSSAVSAVKGLIPEPTPTKLMTQAVRPRANNTNWTPSLGRALPLVKAASPKPIENLDDALTAVQEAKRASWDSFEKRLGPNSNATIDGNKIADAMVDSIDERTKRQNPRLVDSITEKANTYRRDLSLGEAEDFLQSVNGELNSFYAKNKVDRRAALKDPAWAHVVAEADALRDGLYDKLDELVGPGGRDAKLNYASLSNLEGELIRKKNAVDATPEDSVPGQLSKAWAYGKIARGIGTGSPGHVLEGAETLARAKFLKERNSVNGLIRRAFEGVGAPPAEPPIVPQTPPAVSTAQRQLPGPTEHPEGGLSSEGSTFTPLPPVPEEPARALQAKSMLVRDPKTGRMRKVFLGEPSTGEAPVLADASNTPAIDPSKIAKALKDSGAVPSGSFTSEGVRAALDLEQDHPLTEFIKQGMVVAKPDGTFEFGQPVLDAARPTKVVRDPRTGRMKRVVDVIPPGQGASLPPVAGARGKGHPIASMRSDEQEIADRMKPTKFIPEDNGWWVKGKFYSNLGDDHSDGLVTHNFVDDYDDIDEDTLGKMMSKGFVRVASRFRPVILEGMAGNVLEALDKLSVPDDAETRVGVYDKDANEEADLEGTVKEVRKKVRKMAGRGGPEQQQAYQSRTAPARSSSKPVPEGFSGWVTPRGRLVEVPEDALHAETAVEEGLSTAEPVWKKTAGGKYLSNTNGVLVSAIENGNVRMRKGTLEGRPQDLLKVLDRMAVPPDTQLWVDVHGKDFIEGVHGPLRQVRAKVATLTASSGEGLHSFERGGPKQLAGALGWGHPIASQRKLGDVVRSIADFNKGQGREPMEGQSPEISRDAGKTWEDIFPDAPVFFSKALDIAKTKIPGSASGDQILASMRNAGVKADELKWSGLEDQITGQQKVSRADVIKKLEEDGLQAQVREVVKSEKGGDRFGWRPTAARVGWFGEPIGNDGPWVTADGKFTIERLTPSAEFNKVSKEFKKAGYSLNQDYGKYGQTHRFWISPWGESDDPKYKGMQTELRAAIPEDLRLAMNRLEGMSMHDRNNNVFEISGPSATNPTRFFSDLPQAEAFVDNVRGGQVVGKTKWKQYTTPGGEDYKEMLLALPKKFEGQGTPISSTYEDFQSGHWSEPNVLAHARFDTRVVNGKKLLHVAEIQSDWHEIGRDAGYLSGGGIVDANGNEKEAPEDTNGNVPVPDAPFKKDWHELVLRRLLRHAAENGYDGVTFDAGDVQNDRYNLAHHVSRIEYDDDHGFLQAYDLNGDEILREPVITDDGEFSAEKAARYVGKELAEKLGKEVKASGNLSEYEIRESSRSARVNVVDEEGTVVYKADDRQDAREWIKEQELESMPHISGKDMEIGGSGMRGFYDKMIPNYLDKFGKRFGARTSTVKIPEAGYYGADKNKHNEEHKNDEIPEGSTLEHRDRIWVYVAPPKNTAKKGQEVGPEFGTKYKAEQWRLHGDEREVLYFPITPSMRHSLKKLGVPIAGDAARATDQLGQAAAGR